jgi:hypothetical protein
MIEVLSGKRNDYKNSWEILTKARMILIEFEALQKAKEEQPTLNAEELTVDEIRKFIKKYKLPRYAVNLDDEMLIYTEILQDFAKFSQQSISLPSEEEIEQKAFDLSYTYRDDDDMKRMDAVKDMCEEMGYWIKQQIEKNKD